MLLVFDLLLFEFVACLFVDCFVLGFVCWWVCLLVWCLVDAVWLVVCLVDCVVLFVWVVVCWWFRCGLGFVVFWALWGGHCGLGGVVWVVLFFWVAWVWGGVVFVE